jgi:hypothetical protein
LQFGRKKHPKTPKTPPSLSPSSPADYSRPTWFSASSDPDFLHVTATSNSGIWNSTNLEIFYFKIKKKVEFGIQQDQFPIPIHVNLTIEIKERSAIELIKTSLIT